VKVGSLPGILLETDAAELAGRDPEILLDTLLAARLTLIGDAVEGVDTPQASRAAMKSCCSNFSRESFANFSACASAGSLGGALNLSDLL
jgi:hypothetical protein